MTIRSLSLVSVRVESTPVSPASAVDAGVNTVSGGCLAVSSKKASKCTVIDELSWIHRKKLFQQWIPIEFGVG